MNFRIACFILFGITISLLNFSCSDKDQKENEKTSAEVNLKKLPEVNPYIPADISPMDISYFPAGYPLLKMKDKNIPLPAARIIYSRPGKKGRVIFGNTENNLCPYGKPWRLGANEATEIEFFKDVNIEGKEVKAGRYAIYCIPYENRWNIRLNEDLFSWGLQFDSTADILSVDRPVRHSQKSIEEFTMIFQPAEGGTSLLIAWDSLELDLPIAFKHQ